MALKARSQALEVAALREFDLIVIGGGIFGAAVAQDAASRGLSVLLLEKGDFASGSSSRTNKLLHGGWQYLARPSFVATRALSQQREGLEQLAPALVRDVSFIVPLLRSDPLLSVKARLGLTMYALLSWSAHRSNRHCRISSREVLESAPALSADQIAGGLRFHDTLTDDARLVMEVIKSACTEGANAINYVEATGFEVENGRVRCLQAHDRYSGAVMTLRCKACVNAAGVWSDQVMRLVDENWQTRISPIKKVHLMLPASAFETRNNAGVLLPTPDKSYLFVVPWQRAIMIGAADSNYSGALENPSVTLDEVDLLLRTVSTYTQKNLSRSDVIGTWAGLVPAPISAGSRATRASAEYTTALPSVYQGPAGVIGVLGYNLTDFRLVAEQAVDQVLGQIAADLPEPARQSRAKRMLLGGWTDKDDYLSSTAFIAAKARKFGIEPATLEHLLCSYGKDAEIVVELVEREPSLKDRICPDFPQIMAEVAHCAVNEMSVSLEDLLMRRLRLGAIHHQQCLEAAPKVASFMQKLLGWDQARVELELTVLSDRLNDYKRYQLSKPAV